MAKGKAHKLMSLAAKGVLDLDACMLFHGRSPWRSTRD
jgi:hypothetical protein